MITYVIFLLVLGVLGVIDQWVEASWSDIAFLLPFVLILVFRVHHVYGKEVRTNSWSNVLSWCAFEWSILTMACGIVSYIENGAVWNIIQWSAMTLLFVAVLFQIFDFSLRSTRYTQMQLGEKNIPSPKQITLNANLKGIMMIYLYVLLAAILSVGIGLLITGRSFLFLTLFSPIIFLLTFFPDTLRGRS